MENRTGKKRKKQRLLAVLLSAALCVSSLTPAGQALASETETEEVATNIRGG